MKLEIRNWKLAFFPRFNATFRISDDFQYLYSNYSGFRNKMVKLGNKINVEFRKIDFLQYI